jgi:hypothetical protein
MANKRIADWMEGLERWAIDQLKTYDTDTDKGMFLLGVVAGVRAAQDRLPYPLKDKISPMMRLGYTDTRMLIDRALRDGEAPEGDYANLFAALSPNIQ